MNQPVRILQDVRMTDDERRELELLRAENARLRANAPKPKAVSFKVSEKGAISAYGLGRFPVTLYVSQWEKLIAAGQELVDFIKANDEKLSRKE